jgi:hypothetical protein
VNVDGREEAVDEANEPPRRVEGDGDRKQDDTARDRVHRAPVQTSSSNICSIISQIIETQQL